METFASVCPGLSAESGTRILYQSAYGKKKLRSASATRPSFVSPRLSHRQPLPFRFTIISRRHRTQRLGVRAARRRLGIREQGCGGTGTKGSDEGQERQSEVRGPESEVVKEQRLVVSGERRVPRDEQDYRSPIVSIENPK